MFLNAITFIAIILILFLIIINNKRILKSQKLINNIFLLMSAMYFYISHFYFYEVISSNHHDKEKQAVERNTPYHNQDRTFTRFLTVLGRYMGHHAIEFILFLYFVLIIMYIEVKKQTFGGIIPNLSSIMAEVGSTSVTFAKFFMASYIFSIMAFYLARNLFNINSFTYLILSLANIIMFLIIAGSIYRFFIKDFIQRTKGSDPKSRIATNKLIVLMTIVQDFIFYIPCLMNDIFEKITETRKNMTKKLFIILMIELSVLFAYFVLPMLDDMASKFSGNVVIRDVKRLGGKQVYLRSKPFNKLISREKGVIDANHGVSFWFYLNSKN